jgi:hypothetical protein
MDRELPYAPNRTALHTSYSKQITFAALFAVVLTTGLAGAQSIDEYKAAVAEANNHPDGTCHSIPKESLRERCDKYQDFVTQDCKRSQYSCEGLGTKAFAENIEQKSKAIEGLKQKKEELERRRSSASSDSVRLNNYDPKAPKVLSLSGFSDI